MSKKARLSKLIVGCVFLSTCRARRQSAHEWAEGVAVEEAPLLPDRPVLVVVDQPRFHALPGTDVGLRHGPVTVVQRNLVSGVSLKSKNKGFFLCTFITRSVKI